MAGTSKGSTMYKFVRSASFACTLTLLCSTGLVTTASAQGQSQAALPASVFGAQGASQWNVKSGAFTVATDKPAKWCLRPHCVRAITHERSSYGSGHFSSR